MQKILKIRKGCVELRVNSSVYPLYTVYAAAYVYLDRAYIYLDKDKSGSVLVSIFPKNKQESLDKFGMEFYNELLNYAHYFTSLKANAEAVKAIMQRALFSAAPSLIKDVASKEAEGAIKALEKEEKCKKK
jgi:His-Xaa-Ser system protein HxsD